MESAELQKRLERLNEERQALAARLTRRIDQADKAGKTAQAEELRAHLRQTQAIYVDILAVLQHKQETLVQGTKETRFS